MQVSGECSQRTQLSIYTNRANYEGRSFGYKNQPNLLTFEAGEYSLVVFLFMLISFLHQASPRWSNIINYFPGVEFGPVRFPSHFGEASVPVASPDCAE